MKKYDQTVEKCPVCNNPKLRYSNEELLETEVLYDWVCPKCRAYGSASFKLVFQQLNNAFDRDNNDEELFS